MNPSKGSIKEESNIKAITATADPRAKAPVSPSQTLAGKILKYKKASSEPVKTAINNIVSREES